MKWNEIASEAGRYANEASVALRANRLAVFSGAGISMFRQSRLPGWMDLMAGLLRAIAGEDEQALEECHYVLEDKNGFTRFLFNEMVLNLMVRIFGIDTPAEALKACLETSRYSPSHRVLAWATKHFKVSMLTANFDTLIEQAGGTGVAKLHGTLDELEKARFTADTIFKPLDPPLLAETKRMIEGHVLLVVGYNGEDEFDILPALFEVDPVPERVLWLMHYSEDDLKSGRESPQPSDTALKRLRKMQPARSRSWETPTALLASSTGTALPTTPGTATKSSKTGRRREDRTTRVGGGNHLSNGARRSTQHRGRLPVSCGRGSSTSSGFTRSENVRGAQPLRRHTGPHAHARGQMQLHGGRVPRASGTRGRRTGPGARGRGCAWPCWIAQWDGRTRNGSRTSSPGSTRPSSSTCGWYPRQGTRATCRRTARGSSSWPTSKGCSTSGSSKPPAG